MNQRQKCKKLAINPTHVGMNRLQDRQRPGKPHKPHARGDEPQTSGYQMKIWGINPTHVGMNRILRSLGFQCWDKPHARGDEPLAEKAMEERDA